MPPRPNVRAPSPNVRIGGPPSSVIGTPNQESADPIERRTQLQLKQDELNGLLGRLEAVHTRNEHALNLAHEIRAILSTELRNQKIDQLITILQAPI